MNATLIVRKPADLSVNWAQRVVNKHNQDIKVIKVSVLSVDIGTTTRIKLALEIDGPSEFPRHWFVKLPSQHLPARIITSLPRLLSTEVRFYNELAQSIPLNRPNHLAAQSKFGQGSILVLNDITENGAIAGNSIDALTAQQALLVVQQLAHFHAHFWNKANQDPRYHWLNSSVRRLEDALGSVLAVPLMKRGLAKAGSIIPTHLHAPALRYASKRKQALGFLSHFQQTLIHHDCHPGNLFWHKSMPGLLDWQLVRIGEGISDIAYFLATALEPAVRRHCETQLILQYFLILQSHGITDFSLDQLIERYRAHLVYPFEAMVDTLSVGHLMNLENNLALLRRTAAAVEDFDAFNALPL